MVSALHRKPFTPLLVWCVYRNSDLFASDCRKQIVESAIQVSQILLHHKEAKQGSFCYFYRNEITGELISSSWWIVSQVRSILIANALHLNCDLVFVLQVHSVCLCFDPLRHYGSHTIPFHILPFMDGSRRTNN